MNELDPKLNPDGKKFPFQNVPPRLFVIITLFTIFFTYQILGGILTASVVGLDVSPNSDPVIMRALTAFSQFMFILFPVFLLSYLQGNNFKDTFKIKKPNVSILLLSILGIFLIQPALEAFMHFQHKLIYSLPLGADFFQALEEFESLFEELTLSLVTANNIPELIGVILVIAVTPAICEEFFFRGLVLKNFERSFTAVPAIVYTGILFAIFHFHPLNIIPLALLGYYLSFIAYYSGSIYTSITAHFINNLFAVLALYYLGAESFDKSTIGNGDDLQIGLFGIGSFILFIFILKAIKKIALKTNSESKTTPFVKDE